jgi:hypothetical protein
MEEATLAQQPVATIAPEEAKVKEAEDKKLAAKVTSEKKVYEESTTQWRKDILEIWKAMNGELSASVYPWENPQFIPKMRTEVAFVVPFIFSGDPQMEIDIVGDEDKEVAFILDKMLSYRVEKNPRFYNTALAWVTQGCGLGTSMMKICWKFEQTAKGTVDKPMYSVPNILDIYQNPVISETEDQTSVIERIAMTVADVKANSAFNENKMKVTAKKRKGETPYGSDVMDQTDLNDVDSMNDELQMVDIHERWTKDSITTVADSGTGPILLRNEPNPYGFIPYSKFVYENEIIPNRCNGKGIGQNTLGLQEMYYDLFNLVMLNLKIVVNKMWRIDPGSRVNPQDLVARPGGTIRATKDEAEWVEQSDLKQSGFEMLNLIADEHKRASGATDLIQGSAGSRTLGQDQLAQSNSSNRFELVRRRLKSALSELGWMTLKMELQNLQSVESEIMKIFPETERANVFSLLMSVRDNVKFDVSVRGDTVLAANKDILAKQMLDLYNLVSPTMQPQEQRHFAQEIARMRGMTNVKELIPDAMPMQIDPNTGQPMMGPDGMPMQGGMPQGGPMNGNMLPTMGGQPSAEGINESTYGFEQPRI